MICGCRLGENWCWSRLWHDCDTAVTSQSYCRSCTKQVPGTVTAKEGRLKSEFVFFHWSSLRLQNIHKTFQPSMSATYLSSSNQQIANRWTITISCEQRLHFRSVSEMQASCYHDVFFQVLDRCHSRLSATITNHPSHKFSFSLGIDWYVFLFHSFFLLHSVPRHFQGRPEIWIAFVSQR